MLKSKTFILRENQYRNIVVALLRTGGIDVSDNFETHRLFDAGISPVRVASMCRVLFEQKVPLSELSGRLNKHFLTKRCGCRG
jgi:hypothetical protein